MELSDFAIGIRLRRCHATTITLHVPAEELDIKTKPWTFPPRVEVHAGCFFDRDQEYSCVFTRSES
jgi:hypothetical protein